MRCCWVTADLYEQQTFTGLLGLPQPAVSLFCRAAFSSGDWILHREALQCVVVGSLQTCMNSRPSHMCCHSHSLLSACFAEQHCALGIGFCIEKPCIALLLTTGLPQAQCALLGASCQSMALAPTPAETDEVRTPCIDMHIMKLS